MADQHTSEGPSTSNGSGGSSESTVNVNIKTLDSQNHAFDVDKNIQVSAFKEIVATRTGVPVAQQRLIFRGKALMDDHLLSEYHLEDGDTLHLVIRQPSQSQLSATASTGEATQGQEPTTGAPRNRIGHIAHSVVLGTINVGDQGDGLVPDINRVIGAVLNSIGVGSQTGGHHPAIQVNALAAAPQGNEAEGLPRNSGSQNQQHGQAFPRQSLNEGMQIPLGAALPVPSLNMPIPDSLHTLTEFMNHMESVLSRNANQSNLSTATSSSGALPTNSRGQSTPETLSIVLRHTERLVGSHVASALSRLAGRLEQDGNSADLTVRGQLQAESVQLGLAMQHLGAQFLELGRTLLTLRMGQSPAESLVNAGPAVYISPSGPNPIMVQPFPLQTHSLFGGTTSGPFIPGSFSPFGIGSASRNVNIHIHTVGARPANGDGTEGDQASGIGSGDSSQSRAPPTTTTTTASAVPLRPHVSFSGASQPGQSESTSVQEQSISSGAETEAKLGESQIPGECRQVSNEPNVSSAGASQGVHHTGASSTAPIGLGIGDLQPKRRLRQSRTQARSGDTAASSSQSEQSLRDGQQILQSLASLSSSQPSVQPSSHSARGVAENSSSGGGNDGPDISNVMSQVLQSPALNGLLGGISSQTGLGTPDTLRNMMQQLTQSPGMMSTVNQIAQQIDSQDLGGMFAGLGARPGTGGGGGGVDLSSMFQQMMPLVSQALGGVSTTAQQAPTTETTAQQALGVTQRIDSPDIGNMFAGLGAGPGSGGGSGTVDLSSMFQQMMPLVSQALGSVSTTAQQNEMGVHREKATTNQNLQMGLQDVAQSIARHNPPEEIFRSIVQNAVQLHHNGEDGENLVNGLCSTEGLANEFMEVLHRDISQRIRDETKPPRKP